MFSGVIIGRLGQDPELRSTSSGTPVCSVSVATDAGWGDTKVTTWTKIVAWGKQAEFLSKNFSKGDSIVVSGEVSLKTWEDKNGDERQSLELNAHQIGFAGSKKSDGGESRREEPRRQERSEEPRSERRQEGRRDAPREERRASGGF